jgi:hypothetical protein
VYVHCNSLYEDFDFDEEGQVGRNRIEKERDARQLHGWFPIYDTMRGLCGELQVTVYIQHIMDFNPVEDSSIGVQVTSKIPHPSHQNPKPKTPIARAMCSPAVHKSLNQYPSSTRFYAPRRCPRAM